MQKKRTPTDFTVSRSGPEKSTNVAYQYTIGMLSINYNHIKCLAADSVHGVLSTYWFTVSGRRLQRKSKNKSKLNMDMEIYLCFQDCRFCVHWAWTRTVVMKRQQNNVCYWQWQSLDKQKPMPHNTVSY